MSLPELMRILVDALAAPTLLALLLAATVSVIDCGAAIGERLLGLRRLAEAEPSEVAQLARRRIERADLLARVGPMLGLMGTLIPLGPGLAALGQGNVALLADAVTVAFDTTVLGLLVGVIGFVLSRLRRRWYDRLLDAMEAEDG